MEVRHRKRVTVKIVIIGNSGVGKTSLMKRYLDGEFNNRRIMTLGASYFSKEVTRGNQSVLLALWDTAGTERQRPLMPQYYRGAKAAIVCFDLSDRQSWQMLRTWVIDIKDVVPNCKIIICGTKKDILNRDVSRATIDLYINSMQVPYIETSSRTAENVEKLFTMVVDEVWDDAINAPEMSSSRFELTTLPMVSQNRGCC